METLYGIIVNRSREWYVLNNGRVFATDNLALAHAQLRAVRLYHYNAALAAVGADGEPQDLPPTDLPAHTSAKKARKAESRE